MLSDEEKEKAKEMREKREQLFDKLVEWLESQDNVHSIRDGNYSIDFTIGDVINDWPSNLKDDEIKAIHRSSLSKQSSAIRPTIRGEFIKDIAIHLPPAEEKLKEDIVAELDLGDEFMIHFGSRALGGIAAPDGVLTPHIHLEEATGVTPVQLAVSKALTVYENVYEGGDLAIKKLP